MEILVDVAVHFYGEVARAVERECKRVALLLSLDSVGAWANLITFDILSNALYLYFNFTFKFKLSHRSDFHVVLGVRHSVCPEGVGVDVLPFTSINASFYLEVVFQVDARWRFGYHQSVFRRHGDSGKAQSQYH